MKYRKMSAQVLKMSAQVLKMSAQVLLIEVVKYEWPYCFYYSSYPGQLMVWPITRPIVSITAPTLAN